MIAKVILYWLIGMILSILIHEMGHILAGLVNGWKFYMLIIGPIKIYRENINEGIKVKFEKNMAYWGGTGAAIPASVDGRNIDIWSKVLIAGPLSSLAAAIIFVPFILMYKSFFWLMVSLVCLALGLVNIIPFSFRTGFFFNDGKRYVRLRGKGRESEEEMAIFRIVEVFSVQGDSAVPDMADCQCLIESDDMIIKYYGYYILYNYARNTGNKELMQGAAENMEKLKGNVTQNVIDMFVIE